MDWFSEFTFFTEQEMKDLKTAYEQGGLSKCATRIMTKLNDMKNAELNIAVTGDSGAGKSTFINAMRGLRGCDEGAAKTGINETTMERTPYKHPTFPNVCFWDLPGVGTTKFPMKDYVSNMGFTTYDFFIIISPNRFTENDANVAKEIQILGKKLYFVRSQIDNTIRSLEMEGEVFDTKKVLDEVKQNISRGLTTAGISEPIIFLISSFSLNEFEFPQLKETLVNNLDRMKKDVLLMSLPSTTVKIVEQKRDQLMKRIWMVAIASGAVGAVAVPGLTFVVNPGIIATVILDFRKSLRLDDASIESLANIANKSVEFLKAEVKTPLMGEVNNALVHQMFGRSSFFVEVVQSMLPLIGSIFGAVSSFRMTSKLLTDALDELVENAQKLVKVAFAPDPSHPQ